MSRPPLNTFSSSTRFLAILALPAILSTLAALWFLFPADAVADPFDRITVDGTITPDTLDWYPEDLVTDDRADDDLAGRSANVRSLWVTWNADSLFVAVKYQDFGLANPELTEGFSLFVDLDRGTGSENAALLDTLAGNFLMPPDHRIELLIGRPVAEAFPGNVPEVWRIDDADGSATDLSAQVARAQGFGVTKAGSTALVPFWMNAEFGLPWSLLYPDGATTVPAFAAIKLVAVATAGSAERNGYDSAPDNPGLNGGLEPVLLENFHVSVVDRDGDGQPDPSDGSIGGTVTLPGDPGTGSVSAQAFLTDFPGRILDVPVSSFTGADGQRNFRIARLPAGSYTIDLRVRGYLPASTTVTLGESEQLTGVDLTLQRATEISGTIDFLTGDGDAGEITLLDSQAETVDSSPFPAAGGEFAFFVADGGQYSLRAEAPTYITSITPVTVIAGQDVTGLEILLQRRTEISGQVVFLAGPVRDGTLYFLDAAGDTLDSKGYSPLDQGFSFFTETGGNFRLYSAPVTYFPADTTVTVTAGVDLTGLEVLLERAPRVSGTIVFENSEADTSGTVTAFFADSGEPVPEASVGFSGDTTDFELFLLPGRYRLAIEAPGYLPSESVVEVIGHQDVPLAELSLTAVRATSGQLTDADGFEISQSQTTVSLPDQGLFFYAPIRIEARDDQGRLDLFDVDGNLAGCSLVATKMNDFTPAGGDVVFAAATDTSEISTVGFGLGIAEFLVRDDAVEVLRLHVICAGGDTLARFPVVFGEPQPAYVLLESFSDPELLQPGDSLAADGIDQLFLKAQIFDSAGNTSQEPGVSVIFTTAENSTGQGSFQPATVLTESDGSAVSILEATGAGQLELTVVTSLDLEVRIDPDQEGPATLPVTVLPGPAARWEISTASRLVGVSDPVEVTAQVVDLFSNPAVPEPAEEISFELNPAGLGSLDPESGISDDTGRVTTLFTPVGNAGALSIRGQAQLPVTSLDIELRSILVETDPRYDEEPSDHNTFPPTDLVAFTLENDNEGMRISIPFSSAWNGLQMHILFETRFDADGADRDPFEQPVNFGHANRPDYALTTKYSANDYGDFRRWNSSISGWDWWNLDDQEYNASGQDGQNLQNRWARKTPNGMFLEIPFEPFGGPPDSLRLEVYLTQDDGEKRSAFDSVPSDATLDLDFDYLDPEPDDWDITTEPVTLSAWSRIYRVKTDFPPVPDVSEARIEAATDTLQAGQPFTLSALVTDNGGGIGDVLADLGALGGSSLTRMFDNGQNGDDVAGDGRFSLMGQVPSTSPGGSLPLIVRGFEATNGAAARDTAYLEVASQVEFLLEAVDPTGDDHGPDLPGNPALFFTYPANSVFVPGAFDLTSLKVYPTVAVVEGETIEMLAFEVGLADFPDPNDPGTADWNPSYGELNVEKIDIMIDSEPGGATEGLPNRRCDFASHDAWDFAIVLDGWYKAVIPSQGLNSAEAWRNSALRADRDILIMGDPQNDTVTGLVRKEIFGNPTAEQIRNWDIAVLMCGHDQGNDAEEFGGIREVVQTRQEWNFGGGNSENIEALAMDLLLLPGPNPPDGFVEADNPQNWLLDYLSPEAVERAAQGETRIILEMSPFVDSGPPVITLPDGTDRLVSFDLLEGAPLAFVARITDDDRVDRTLVQYRPVSVTDGWSVETEMEPLGDDLWSVDVPADWLEEFPIPSPVDGNRTIEFSISAWDRVPEEDGGPNLGISGQLTIILRPPAVCVSRIDEFSPEIQPDDLFSLRMADGTSVGLPGDLLLNLEDLVGLAPLPGLEVADSASAIGLRTCLPLPESQFAPTVPEGTPIGVFRHAQLIRHLPDRTAELLADELESFFDLTLHYTQGQVPEGADELRIGLYEYHEPANRWVLVGGHVNPRANVVTSQVTHSGIYGLYLTSALAYDANEVISGITISPNPFSPNGDGLYDETSISFFLNQRADVTAEIYNIDGRRQQVITESFNFSGADDPLEIPRRVAGLVWDGRNHIGELVPYGIYIIRLIVSFTERDIERSLRSTHPVVIIR